MKVWDLLVRLLHWSLVLAVATAWLSTMAMGIGRAHEPAGYVALGVVATRLLWGGLGPRTAAHYARFTQFVRTPAAVWRYARQLPSHREPRYIGHNPLGGWMVLTLLGCVASTGITGWLLNTDRFWGDDTLGAVHHWLAWTLLALIALHVLGVVMTSWRHRENLVAAMVTGRKPSPQADDIA
jgi:cytochrome b